MIETLKKIKKLEERARILSDCIRRAPQHKNLLSQQISYPMKPTPPTGRLKPIYNYDQKEYTKKAKAQGTGLSNFRDGCIVLGLTLAGSVIGLIVCWIPWVIAVLSWPFSIYYTRKRAYQLYLAECQEREKNNQEIQKELDAYNLRLIEYTRKLEESKKQQQLLPHRLAFINEFETLMKREKEAISNELRSLYGPLNTPLSARGYFPTLAILSYVDSKRASSYEDALHLFNEEITSGHLNPSIDVSKEYRHYSKETLVIVMDEIHFCEEEVEKIYQKLDSHLLNDDFNTNSHKFFESIFEPI